MALLKDLKSRAKRQAEKLMANRDVQRAFEWTTATSRKFRDGLSEVSREVRRQLALPAGDDLHQLKRKLDELSEPKAKEAADSKE